MRSRWFSRVRTARLCCGLKEVKWRWAIAFLFGLIHGFGFSGAVRELGLPVEGLVSSLLSFNVGVECGQLVVVALIFPGILYLRRFNWQVWVVRGCSATIFVFGTMWLVERVTGS